MKRLHKELLMTGDGRYLVIVEHNGKDRLFFMDAHAKTVEDRGLCGNDMSFETRTMKGIYGYGVRFKNDNGGLCFECVDDTGLQHPVDIECLSN